MIKINNKEYNNYTTKITWGNFSVYSNGKKRTGTSPFITFNIDDKILIGLELTFSNESFKECIKETKVDITSYLTDICYEDEKGWISLNTGKYTLYTTRINSNSFKFEFEVNENIEEINIIIDSTIDLL